MLPGQADGTRGVREGRVHMGWGAGVLGRVMQRDLEGCCSVKKRSEFPV